MKLATFLLPGADAPAAGEVRGDEVVAFSDGDTVLDRLASGDRTPADGPSHALGDVRLLAPVSRPRVIFGVGLNYAAHARETGQDLPPAPMVFLKLPSSAAPPHEDVSVPTAVRRLDYEGELAVVMGAGGQVAGYAVANDLSARDLQRREPQWTRAKGFDNSCPYGPWITTADEVADPAALGLKTWVNGELRQDSSTSDLIFGVPEIVAFLTETCTLEAGDLILTGTPSGVGQALDPPQFLGSGDRIRIELDGLGAIEHSIV
ncbi:MAG TPA: fumarylacetoacetate hydrolase family protein [Baekduia sp.]|nr:fumarylacetoacetate hydrolase family protein [Baekduia sp.]